MEKESINEAYKVVFTSPHGRVVLQQILKDCKVLEPITNLDPSYVQYAAGLKNAALSILSKAELTPNDIINQGGKNVGEQPKPGQPKSIKQQSRRWWSRIF